MTARLALLSGVLISSGCGSYCNLCGRHQIYGGTEADGAAVVRCSKDIINPDGPHQLSTGKDVTAILVSCVDLPFSAIGDTFTLPITGYRWFKDRNKQPEGAVAAYDGQPVGGPPAPPSPQLTADSTGKNSR
jgi:uncharacterized protein YceK